jgi:hypothetical protein
MLLGFGDVAVEGPEQFPGQLRPVVIPTAGGGSVTMGPMTIRPAQSVVRVYSPEPGKPSIVARVLPVKVGADGKERIYGLPPTVAYVLALVIVGGAGYLAYRRFAGGGGLVAANHPRRRRRARRRASRRKR